MIMETVPTYCPTDEMSAFLYLPAMDIVNLSPQRAPALSAKIGESKVSGQ
jgi:hypothetical protein